MKSTGIIRRVDDLGRFVIPKELRDTLGIKEGDSLEIFTKGNTVMLRKYQPGCIFCGDLVVGRHYKGKCICKKCIGAIRDRECIDVIRDIDKIVKRLGIAAEGLQR